MSLSVCFRTVPLLALGLGLLLGPALAGAQPQPGRLAQVRAAGELRVCIWPLYYGITYRNLKNGTVSGLDADLAQAFAHDLGVNLKLVDSSFARFIPDLLDNQCDIAMMAVAVTPQRADKVAFSRPYLRSDVYAVTTRNHPRVRSWADIDQRGTRVAVAAGTFHEPLMRERLKQAELVVVKAPQTREGELEAGRVDVFMSDFPFTRKMVDHHDWAQVLPPPAPYFQVPYAWAVKPGDSDWLKTVDRFGAAIKADGRLARAAQRYGLGPILLTE
jgi:ABC-type amino acid transport substrate-binding protein